MRNRSDILDLRNFNAEVIQGAYCGLTSRSRSLDFNFKVLYTELNCNLTGCFCSNLRCKRS